MNAGGESVLDGERKEKEKRERGNCAYFQPTKQHKLYNNTPFPLSRPCILFLLLVAAVVS